MRGSGWRSQQLNALLLYLSKMYFLSVGRFSWVGAHGSIGWLVGGSPRVGHWHGVSPGLGTPVLEHCCDIVSDMACTWAVMGVSTLPTSGKLVGTIPRSVQALNDR